MRFAAVQIPAKIGWFLLNGEKLDELHCIALIFGQFAVLHARPARFFSRRNLQGGQLIVASLFYCCGLQGRGHYGLASGGSRRFRFLLRRERNGGVGNKKRGQDFLPSV